MGKAAQVELVPELLSIGYQICVLAGGAPLCRELHPGGNACRVGRHDAGMSIGEDRYYQRQMQAWQGVGQVVRGRERGSVMPQGLAIGQPLIRQRADFPGHGHDGLTSRPRSRSWKLC